MRAKRSKKYRKIMSAYNLHFAFRTPYQVLCDSNFLRTCHAFHMPIRTFLDNTLHGESRPYLTKCTLEEVTRQHQKKFAKATGKNNSEAQKGRGDGKPLWLPLPEEVPLRYCKHKDAEGNERGIVSEAECLFDLLSGQVKGNEVPKNKQHYVLATAESEEEQQQQKNGSTWSLKRKRGPDIREQARLVPGVPIVYVKRSVMILEELSGSSEKMIRGTEKEKFREGLVGAAKMLKRKREGDSDEEEEEEEEEEEHTETEPRVRGGLRAKGPNPLSVKKKKSKIANNPFPQNGGQAQDPDQTKKQRRKRGKKRGASEDGGSADANSAQAVPAAKSQDTRDE